MRATMAREMLPEGWFCEGRHTLSAPLLHSAELHEVGARQCKTPPFVGIYSLRRTHFLSPDVVGGTDHPFQWSDCDFQEKSRPNMVPLCGVVPRAACH
nr:hypothetical protein Hi04_10k_c5482_00029 [uncultured bacterium]